MRKAQHKRFSDKDLQSAPFGDSGGRRGTVSWPWHFPHGELQSEAGQTVGEARFDGADSELERLRNLEMGEPGIICHALRIHGMIFSNMTIETSGGSQPIQINGLSRRAAEAIEDAVRKAQGAALEGG